MKEHDRLLCLLLPAFLILPSCNKTETGDVPVLSTAEVIGITSTTAICGGNITSDGETDITSRGVCWSTSDSPSIADITSSGGTGLGSFTCNVKPLTGNTTYYIAAYATNTTGTGYGEIKSFTTPPTIADSDGNTYSTVVIGTQTWMAENLKTTSYRNGDPITYISVNDTWGTTENGEYCDYDLIGEITNPYGNFYNWYAVSDSREIAPEGWHIPTMEEWTSLINYLGGINEAGAKMRETGYNHWLEGEKGTNTSGFTALGAGMAGDDHRLYEARFWSATEETEEMAGYLFVDCGNLILITHDTKNKGYSLRCLKD